MKQIILFCAVFLIVVSSCKKDDSDDVDQIPDWLIELIDEIKDDPYYAGTVIYSHDWNNEKYYHIIIPVSSCGYCDLYNSSGEKMDLTNFDLNDYIQNRTNEMFVWYYFGED